LPLNEQAIGHAMCNMGYECEFLALHMAEIEINVLLPGVASTRLFAVCGSLQMALSITLI